MVASNFLIFKLNKFDMQSISPHNYCFSLFGPKEREREGMGKGTRITKWEKMQKTLPSCFQSMSSSLPEGA